MKIPPAAIYGAMHAFGTPRVRAAAGLELLRYGDTPSVALVARELGAKKRRISQAGQISAALVHEIERCDKIRAQRLEAKPAPLLPLRERLRTFVIRFARPAWNACQYRRASSKWAGGEHTVNIYIGKGCAAHSRADRVWSSNGKWAGMDSRHEVWIRQNWKRTVHDKGIAVLANRFTLQATQIDDDTFSASWVRQGRGIELITETGIIKRKKDGTWQHRKKTNDTYTELRQSLQR